VGFPILSPFFLVFFPPIFGVAMVSKVQSCAERHGVRSPVASHWPGAAEPLFYAKFWGGKQGKHMGRNDNGRRMSVLKEGKWKMDDTEWW
jgi:hypothetical protein